MYPAVIQGMLPQKRFLTTFQGITASFAPKQTVSVQVPTLYNIVDLWLQCVGITTAMIQELRLKIGATVIQKWTGVDLDARLQYDNRPAFGAGTLVYDILAIPLRRMGIRGGSNIIGPKGGLLYSGSPKDQAYESTLNCNIAGGGFAAISKVTLEMDLVNTGGTQPSVQLFGRCTQPVEGGPGAVYRVDKQTKSVPNGEITLTKGDMGLDALRPYLNRITLVPIGGGTLDDFQLRYGTNDWWTISADLLRVGATEDNLRTPRAGYYILDFQEMGFGDDMLDMSAENSDILLQFVGTNTAGLFTYYVETLGLPFAPGNGA
jgi:hypothetical protein